MTRPANNSGSIVVALKSHASLSSEGRQESNRPAGRLNFNETGASLIINKEFMNAKPCFSGTAHKDLKGCTHPYLLLKFSQDFLITHSALSGSALKDSCISRKVVLKVPVSDFSYLSDKICAKCWSCMHLSGIVDSTQIPCQDLFKQTKVVLQRINLAQKRIKGNRHDNRCRVNKRESATKKSSINIMPIDVNGNVEGSHSNDRLSDDNMLEKTAIKPLCCNKHVILSPEPEIINRHLVDMKTSMNGTLGDKRKLPPLRIPKERILFQNDEVDDDKTPEYPLKEGDFFFNPHVDGRESLKDQIHTETAEESRNLFSAFSASFSFRQSQSLKTSPKITANTNDDIKLARPQRSLRAQRTSDPEHVKQPRNCQRMQKIKLSEPGVHKPRRARLYTKSSSADSGLGQEADTNGSRSYLILVDSKINVTESSGRSSNDSNEVEITNNNHIPYMSCGTVKSSNCSELPISQQPAETQTLVDDCDDNVDTNSSSKKHFSAASQFQNENIGHAEKLTPLLNGSQQQEDRKSASSLSAVKRCTVMKEKAVETSLSVGSKVNCNFQDEVLQSHDELSQTLDSSRRFDTRAPKRSLKIANRSNTSREKLTVDGQTLCHVQEETELSERVESNRCNDSTGTNDTMKINKSSAENESNSSKNSRTHTGKCNNNKNRIIMHDENNQRVDTLDSEMENVDEVVNLPAVKAQLKRIEYLLLSKEQRLPTNLSVSGSERLSDITSESWCTPLTESKISAVTEEQHSSTASVQPKTDSSACENTGREQPDVFKPVILNIDTNTCPVGNKYSLSTSSDRLSETLSDSLESKHVSKPLSKDILENIPAVALSVPERVSSENDPSHGARKNNSLSCTNSQSRILEKDQLPISDVHSEGVVSVLQQGFIHRLTQQGDTRQSSLIVGTNYTENIQVGLMSEKAPFSVVHLKDRGCASSASQKGNETKQFQQNCSDNMIPTTRVSQIDSVEYPATAVGNLDINAKAGECNFVHGENKLLHASKTNPADTDNFVLPSKRPHCTSLTSPGTCLASDFNEIAGAAMLKESEYQAPRNKVRKKEFYDGDQAFVPACNISAKNTTSPVKPESMSMAHNLEFKFKQQGDCILQTIHSSKKYHPALVQQCTEKTAETCEIPTDCDEVNHNRQSEKVPPNPCLSAENCNDLVFVSHVNRSSCQSTPEKVNPSERSSFLKSTVMLDPEASGNLSPHFILQPAEKNSHHHKETKGSIRHLNRGMQNSSQSEKSAVQSSVSSINIGYPDTFDNKTNRVYDNLQSRTLCQVNVKNASLTPPSLWANMPSRQRGPASINTSNAAVSLQFPSVQLERQVFKRSNRNDYNNILTVPAHVQIFNLGNQQTSKCLVSHPAFTVTSENLNMLRHEQAMQMAQRNKTLVQPVKPEGNIRYPSWALIPHEESSIDETETASTKWCNSRPVANSKSGEMYIPKLQHAPFITDCSHNVIDSASGLSRLGYDNGLPKEQANVPAVVSTKDQNIPCQPLDLSRRAFTGRGTLAPESLLSCSSAQQQYFVPGGTHSQTSTLQQPKNRSSMYSPDAAKLNTPPCLNSSCNYLSLDDRTRGSNKDLAAPPTQMLTLPNSARTNALPAILSSNKHPVTRSKFPLAEIALLHGVVPHHGNLHSVSVQSKSSPTQITASCERNATSAAHSDIACEQVIQKKQMHIPVSTPTTLQECSPIVSSVSNTCVSGCQTLTVTTPLTFFPIVTHYSGAGPIVVSSNSGVTTAEKSSECILVWSVPTALASSRMVCSSSNFGTPAQKRSLANSDNPNVSSGLGHRCYDFANTAEAASSRLAPLPVKDFFTHSPKENTYSSLLMAKIASQSKRRLGLQKGAEVLPLVQPQNSKDSETFEINNSLQKNLFIDLTDDNDNCDVVSISSNDSFDDYFRNDFLNATLGDRVSTPASITTYSSISDVTVAEGSQNLPPAGFSSEISNTCTSTEAYCVQTDERDLDCVSLSAGSDYTEHSGVVSTNITDGEVTSPSFATENCQVHNMQKLKGNIESEDIECCSDNISGAEKTDKSCYMAVRSVSYPDTHSVLTHPCCDLTDSETTAVSNKCSTANKNIIASYPLKSSPVGQDNLGRKLPDVLSSQAPSDGLPSGNLMPSVTTNSAGEIQPMNSQEVIHPFNRNTSNYDNSTQRAAATLLELSANPLYSPYMISPETSDSYQEKVYQVHPTLEDSAASKTDLSQERHEYCKSVHDTQSVNDVVGTALHRSGARSGRRVGRPLKDQYNASDTANSVEDSSVLSMTGVACINISNSIPPVRIHSVQMSDGTQLQESQDRVAISDVKSVEKNKHFNFGQSKVHNSPSSSLSIATTVTCISSSAMSSAAAISTYTGRAGSQTASVKIVSDERRINTVSCKSSRKYTRTVANLTNASIDPGYPAVVVTNIQTHDDLSSTSTSMAAVSRGANIFGSFAPNIYNHISGMLPSDSADGEVPFIGLNTVSAVSYDQTSSHRSSMSLKRTKSTQALEGKLDQRYMNIREKVLVIDAPFGELSSETESVISDIESPTSQGSLQLLTNNDSIQQTGSKIKNRKRKRRRKGKQKYNSNQKTLHSDIDDVLKELNSNERANIVVTTSYEDGLQILSLRSESGADVYQQNPQNGDQIVPVNVAHVRDSWAKEDAELSQRQNSVPNANSGIVDGQPFQHSMISSAVNTLSPGSDNSTEQAIANMPGNNLANTEEAKEIEKERAVTSLLAAMMHNKFKGSVHL